MIIDSGLLYFLGHPAGQKVRAVADLELVFANLNDDGFDQRRVQIPHHKNGDETKVVGQHRPAQMQQILKQEEGANGDREQ